MKKRNKVYPADLFVPTYAEHTQVWLTPDGRLIALVSKGRNFQHHRQISYGFWSLYTSERSSARHIVASDVLKICGLEKLDDWVTVRK